MKISVVTISFNQAKYLKQCIDSVLTQDYENFEYIVVDPGSKDGSREIIGSYADRIIRVFEEDTGPADGLNRGFSRATGDVLGFVNADDFLLPGALRSIANHFTRNGLDHFISGCGYISRASQRQDRITPTRITKIGYLYGAVTVFQPGTFFPRWQFEKVGGFNANNHTCWDGELFLELVCAGFRHEVIRDEIAVFRTHSESISGSGKLREAYRADINRLFRSKLGRTRNVFDNSLSFILRMHKVLTRPLFSKTQAN
jgi:glycosyltransferase involved in cell wall biosynthesis